jgi:hypothetical protein
MLAAMKSSESQAAVIAPICSRVEFIFRSAANLERHNDREVTFCGRFCDEAARTPAGRSPDAVADWRQTQQPPMPQM